MQGVAEETEGVLALGRLQRNEYKLWGIEEIESSKLSNTSKKILYFIANENSFKRVPEGKEIIKRFKMTEGDDRLYTLKKREMALSITIQETVAFYGLEYLGYNKYTKYTHVKFHPPSHLEWLNKYLEEIAPRRRGSTLSWPKKLKSPRSPAYSRHWIALLEKDGLPPYLPLGFHIPKT